MVESVWVSDQESITHVSGTSEIYPGTLLHDIYYLSSLLMIFILHWLYFQANVLKKNLHVQMVYVCQRITLVITIMTVGTTVMRMKEQAVSVTRSMNSDVLVVVVSFYNSYVMVNQIVMMAVMKETNSVLLQPVLPSLLQRK